MMCRIPTVEISVRCSSHAPLSCARESMFSIYAGMPDFLYSLEIDSARVNTLSLTKSVRARGEMCGRGFSQVPAQCARDIGLA